MLIVRPIQLSDEQALYAIAEESGHGFTSLPADKEQLRKKIEQSIASFQKKVTSPADEMYLMVLEDPKTSYVVGTTGLMARVGIDDDFYHYRLDDEQSACEQLGVNKQTQTLTLCHDYSNSSELCSLFLRSDARQGNNGKFLSRSRFLMLAEFPERFCSRVIAEMRGVCDEQGKTPFYEWLQEYFTTIDFSQADYLSGIGEKDFIAKLMPKHPIYTNLLPEKAQEVIGRVHHQTKPALKMLENEGFAYEGYVDIFDAGPTIECSLSEIASVKKSFSAMVQIKTIYAEQEYFMSNNRLEDYRIVSDKAELDRDNNIITISPETASALRVQAGEHLRVVV